MKIQKHFLFFCIFLFASFCIMRTNCGSLSKKVSTKAFKRLKLRKFCLMIHMNKNLIKKVIFGKCFNGGLFTVKSGKSITFFLWYVINKESVKKLRKRCIFGWYMLYVCKYKIKFEIVTMSIIITYAQSIINLSFLCVYHSSIQRLKQWNANNNCISKVKFHVIYNHAQIHTLSCIISYFTFWCHLL